MHKNLFLFMMYMRFQIFLILKLKWLTTFDLQSCIVPHKI